MNAPKSLFKTFPWFVLAGLLGMAIMLAASPGAHAGNLPVTITVTSDGDLPVDVSDMVTVTDAAGNNLLPPLIVTEDQEVGGVTFFNSLPGSWDLPNTLFLDEPNGAISDILTLINQGGRAFIYFTSDDDQGNLGTIPIITPQFTFTESDTGITVVGTFNLIPRACEPDAVGHRHRWRGCPLLAPTQAVGRVTLSDDNRIDPPLGRKRGRS